MANSLTKNAFTCIIPFYNEGSRVLTTLAAITRVRNLTAIICVDDGSKDTTYKKMTKKYPTVQLIRSEKNEGKSEAVYKALEQTRTEYILLMDGDLTHISQDEITRALTIVIRDKHVDMLVFEREADPWYSKLIRGNITATGQRILRTKDLFAIYQSKPERYQLEFAINFYMTDNHKQVYWIPWNARNTSKIEKFGTVEGIQREIEMYRHIASFSGYRKTAKNILTFCWREYPKTNELMTA